MIQLNFQEFRVYGSINHSIVQTLDVREHFADMIYTNVNGIRAHALAMKIYESTGETVYNADEVKLIRTVANNLCVPGFIDGLNEQIKQSGHESNL